MTTPGSRLRRGRSWLFAAVLGAVVAVVVPLSVTGSAAAHDSNGSGPKPTIVLVHGDWADGSSWSAVIPRLQRQGYQVVAPPNQLRGPSVDAPYLASFLQTIPGPIVLVAHSYGGFVITNAATGNANVKALVYIDAFVPDTNQTLQGLLSSSPESCLVPNAFNAVPFSGGLDLYLRIPPNPDYPGFNECFANGVPPNQAAVLSAVERLVLWLSRKLLENEHGPLREGDPAPATPYGVPVAIAPQERGQFGRDTARARTAIYYACKCSWDYCGLVG